MSTYKNLVLFIWAGILIVAVSFTFLSSEVSISKDYDLKVEASQLMQSAMDAIKERKLELGYQIEETDINQTGMIGERYTVITTTLGVLDSKRTSTNPNFAAVIVDMLIKAGAKKGDYVGITFSGSFPTLNIAVSCAVEVMHLKPLIMCSIGASSYGANNPQFTYVDMAHYLYEEGYFSFNPNYVSLGGAKDIGEDMPEDIRTEILARMNSLGKEVIIEENYKKNINIRKDIFKKSGIDMKVFINVGGNLVAMGQEKATFPNINGLITKRNIVNSDDMGLLDYFLNQDIPVIHILDIKKLAYKYGLPIDPSPIPAIGEGKVYLETKYNLLMPIIAVVVSFIVLVFYKVFPKYLE